MLNKETMLNMTNNGLDIFKHYISANLRPKKPFYNPLYDDKTPRCYLLLDGNGRYRMYDHGSPDEHSGDAFFLVGALKGLDCNRHFEEILDIINRDMNLGLTHSSPYSQAPRSQAKFAITAENNEKQKPKPKPYSIKTQPIRESELTFWADYGITPKTLDKYGVLSLTEFSSISSENKDYTLRSSISEPIFCYKQDGFVKIYRPNSSIRFLYGGEKESDYCFGFNQLPSKGDMIFITGGEKDVLSLAARGFSAICFNGETAKVPDSIIQSLYYRYKHIVVLYDSDKTGIEYSKKIVKDLSQFSIKRMELPLSGEKGEKDISDYFKMGYTKRDFINLFLTLLDSIYNTTMTIIKSCEVNFDNPPQSVNEIISVAGVPLGSEGNILCITGGEGTGKSNYIAALVAGAIRDKDTAVDTLGVKVSNNTNKGAVLLYDTEQSEMQLYKNVSNLMRRANLEQMPDEFKAFCLTSLSRKERLNTIIESMDRYYYEFGGIHLVVIDGVADLVTCANDEMQSIAVVEELYRLAGIYKTCVVGVLHFVPNGLKLRGHLGSELQRKSAAILSIERDKDPAISVVKALKVRDGSPLDVPLMQFSWCKTKGMHTYNGDKSVEAREQRKREELLQAIEKIFTEVSHITTTELKLQLVSILGIGERTAMSYIKYLKENNIITKDMYNEKLLMKGL